MKLLLEPNQKPHARKLLVLLGLIITSAAFGQSTITNIPTLGGTAAMPTALNNLGQVVGVSLIPGDAAEHAFLFSGGVLSDLGTLGGRFGQASGINDAGQIIGEGSITGDQEVHGFLINGGTIVDLGTLGGTASSATAINTAGLVAGEAQLPGNANLRAFLYSGGSLQDLGTLGGSFSSPVGLNRLGQVTGNSTTPGDAAQHGFLFSGNIMYDLGTLGGASSSASAINDAGQVVGQSDTTNFQTHAFILNNGVLLDLGTLGGTYSTAYAINRSGQVIGDASTAADAQYHAFLSQNGTMLDLGTLGGDFSSAAAINNLGQVVGNSDDPSLASLPFLWQNGVMVDLNSLLPPNSGWHLDLASFINDAGQIVGAGSFNGDSTWYLLSPSTANRPPSADAGANQVVECGRGVVLDGGKSSDPDHDPLTFEWREGQTVLGHTAVLSVQLSLGSHLVTLTVTDPSGLSSQSTVTVKVVDTTLPFLACPASLTAVANANCQAAIPDLLGNLNASDNCTPANQLTKSQNPSAGALVGLGAHPITVTVADAAGNASTCGVTFNVVDSVPPALQSLAVNPDRILQSNRHMVPVVVTASASDNCDSAPVSRIIAITSSDPTTGPGDNTSPDWQITGPLTADVRAERSAQGGDRIYTITVQCTDASGNKSIGSVTVVVPKSAKR